MQDNAPIHNAKIIKKWFVDASIPVMEWPPYSPDLNPIEHLWHALKSWIREHYPELEDMGKSNEDYLAMSRAIHEGWEALGDELMSSLIGSMRARCEAVIRARGWHTKY